MKILLSGLGQNEFQFITRTDLYRELVYSGRKLKGSHSRNGRPVHLSNVCFHYETSWGATSQPWITNNTTNLRRTFESSQLMIRRNKDILMLIATTVTCSYIRSFSPGFRYPKESTDQEDEKWPQTLKIKENQEDVKGHDYTGWLRVLLYKLQLWAM